MIRSSGYRFSVAPNAKRCAAIMLPQEAGKGLRAPEKYA
jgi:hypothetical protein